MSLRKKPLVRFDTESRARLVLPESNKASTESMRVRRKRSGVRSAKGRPRVVKGRVNVRIAGYLGVQKLAPSKLIKFLPSNKVKQAAKRVLLASGVRPSKGKGKKKRRKGKKKRKKRTSRRRGAARPRTVRRKRRTRQSTS